MVVSVTASNQPTTMAAPFTRTGMTGFRPILPWYQPVICLEDRSGDRWESWLW
jgi:hypothetical protein